MALVDSARKPINIAVREVMATGVHACAPDDDLQAALETMRHFQVRRLPVVADNSALQGVLSFDDVIFRALSPDAPTSADLVATMREILKRREEAIVADEAIW